MSEINEANMKTKRNKLFKTLFSVVIFCAIAWGLYYFFISSNHIKTNNAYVDAEIAQVTPSTGGTVQSIYFNDTDVVNKDDVLVVIDDMDAQLALSSAQAELAKAQIEHDRRKLDFDRRQAIAKSGSVSEEELSTAENGYKAASAILKAAEIMVKKAKIDLSRTTIRSPIDGIVAKRRVQLGQRVQPGTQLMSVVPLDKMHVDANFKEVQIRKIKVGQPVEVTSDLYGSKVKYKGQVAGIAGGTGAAFSLIPAQNATGNWIKVVQRLPVRVTLDAEQLKKYPLHVGLSMHVDIDISGS